MNGGARVKAPVNAWTHGVAFAAATAGLVYLVRLGVGHPATLAVLIVYGIALMMLFGASALYHALTWSPRLTAVLRGVDHASIVVGIAGTYTPVLYFGLSGPWRVWMLAGVWTLTAAAVFVQVRWIDAPRWFSTAVYVLLGWAALIPAVKLVAALPRTATLLIALGGLFYTAGAIVYARKWPDPLPQRFGFHEVFHLLVVAGASVHFVAVASMVR